MWPVAVAEALADLALAFLAADTLRNASAVQICARCFQDTMSMPRFFKDTFRQFLYRFFYTARAQIGIHNNV